MYKKNIFMYSGQGSQYFQMGKELYEKNERFKYWMNYCNNVVMDILKKSIVDIIYFTESKNTPFDNITYSNPALLCIEYSLTKTLQEANIQPDLILGYSLGEITTAVISDSISLEEGLSLVIKIANLVENNTENANMLAIIDSTDLLDDYRDLFKGSWLTGINFDKNFVVTGSPDKIKIISKELDKQKIMTQLLPVNYGFHTELIDPIEVEMKKICEKITFKSLNLTSVSAFTKKEVDVISGNHIWDVLRGVVDFKTTIQNLLKENENCNFIDVGPSGVLSTFVKYILSSETESCTHQTINQFGKDINSFNKLKSILSEPVLI